MLNKSTGFVFCVLICLMCSGCGLIGLYYGTNKKRTFKSREEYLSFAESNSGLSRDKFVFLSRKNLDILLLDVVQQKLVYFYGVNFSNNFAGGNQLEDTSCSGQIVSLYRRIPGKLEDVQVISSDTVPILKELNINNNKKTMVFLYSSNSGRYFKVMVRSILKELQSDPQFDYVVVAID